MDAAQMLTAREIARQCQDMARGTSQDPPSTSPRRHLRLAEPVTQPIPRVFDEAPENDRPSGRHAGAQEELTSRERALLAFEAQWWKNSGAKEQAIRELFDMSASRYYQLLNGLLEKPEAMRVDPMLVKRLRKVRERRRGARGSGAGTDEPRGY